MLKRQVIFWKTVQSQVTARCDREQQSLLSCSNEVLRVELKNQCLFLSNFFLPSTFIPCSSI